MLRRISLHLALAELACINRLGRPWNTTAPGQVIAEYPDEWLETRAAALGVVFEGIRSALGDEPIVIVSAYRTADYNREVGGAGASQHVQGRAIDIRHTRLKAPALHDAILELATAGKLPLLGGLGHYDTFVHMDVRPKVGGHLARWTG
jgi:uncharacterized protein YcbK (DUF882 family)